MKDEEKIKSLVDSCKIWNPPGCPHLYYPEDIRQEYLTCLSKGKWWDWLPCWAGLLGEFAKEVQIVARACGWDKLELSKFLISSSDLPHEENPIYAWVSEDAYPHSREVTLWECSQAVQCWIFYHLRPQLNIFVERELDCIKN